MDPEPLLDFDFEIVMQTPSGAPITAFCMLYLIIDQCLHYVPAK